MNFSYPLLKRFSCSPVVESMPCDQEVAGSNPVVLKVQVQFFLTFQNFFSGSASAGRRREPEAQQETGWTDIVDNLVS